IQSKRYVEDLQVRIEKLEEIFSYLRNRKLKQKEVILVTDDGTSSKDDTSSNDEISSSEYLINYLSAHDVEWKLHKNTQEEPPKPHYDPIKTELTALVADMGAFDDPRELFDTLMGLRDDIRVAEAKLNQETHFGTITKEQRDPTSNYHLLMKQNKRMSFFGVVRSDLDEFPAGDEMFLELDEVVFKIHTKGYFEYDPLSSINLYIAHKKQNLGKYYYKNMEWEEDDASLRCSSSTPFSTRVKIKISKRKKTSVIHDEGGDRKKSLVTGGRKGKEKVIEDEGICSKGNKANVSIYKRAMVNGKAKMVEDVEAVKRGKERGVVIEDGGFSNDGGKETVVTKRAIGS
ncbi:hypothetical protein Tco_0832455, partial [Tanacetum coccineum]